LTEARLIKVKSSLSRQLDRPGGRSLAEAERLAEAALQTHRTQITAELGELIGKLEVLCADRSEEGQTRVYALAGSLVDLAGFFDTGAFFEAAYGLCDLADRSRAAGRWRWGAVEVHVNALRLLHGRGLDGRSEDSDEIIAGLRQVTATVLG
jgi:hypothetical protein